LGKKKLAPIAHKLRRNQTEAEKRLLSHPRSRQLESAKFVRQEQIGPHIADFACRDARIAIELDGGQHSEATDAPRTRVVEAFGYRIIRFWNNDVLDNSEGVLEVIRQELLIAFDRHD
jgi:very-short-patch-repair endonuclease